MKTISKWTNWKWTSQAHKTKQKRKLFRGKFPKSEINSKMVPKTNGWNYVIDKEWKAVQVDFKKKFFQMDRTNV